MDTERHSRYFQVGFGDALQQHFPGALLANDDLFQHSETLVIAAEKSKKLPADLAFATGPKYYKAGFWNAGYIWRVGKGAVGIGAQSPQLYFETSGPWTCNATGGDKPDGNCPPHGQSPGIDQAVHITAGVPFGAFKRSPFNYLLLQCQAVRAMTLANPDAPVRPWIDYKSYGSRQAALPDGPTAHYQERQFHLFLSGVDTFYYFNPWDGLPTRATAADHALVSALLTELDDVIGCEGARRWVQDANLGRWRDSFFLTGMTLGAANTVWRLSFNGDAPALTTSGKGVTVYGVKFELEGQVVACDLHFAAGRVEKVEGTTAAVAGVWIVQDTTRGASDGELCTVLCGDSSFDWPLQNRTVLKSDDVEPPLSAGSGQKTCQFANGTRAADAPLPEGYFGPEPCVFASDMVLRANDSDKKLSTMALSST